jgi:hypothetical protein
MIQSIIALMAIAVLIGMSLRANARFRDEPRLPMQWALDGSVNWSAPRRLALALTPALASCVLAAVVAITLFLKPRPGQEGLEIPVVSVMSLGFLGIHWAHIRLIERSLKRNGS